MVKIVGCGAYAPARILSNFDLEKLVDTTDEWIHTRTGIKTRRIAAPSEATSDLAAKAASQALNFAEILPEEVELIMVATLTPDMLTPATANIVQAKIGAINAACFDLNAACAGFIYALACGTGFINSKMYNNCLIIGAEVLSRFVNWQDRNTAVLFGDGAGAVILRRTEEKRLACFSLGSQGENWSAIKITAGGTSQPASKETVENNLHYIEMNGKLVFEFAVRIMQKSVEKVLSKANLKISDIDWFIPHQANIRIIQAAVKNLKLDKRKILINLDKYGNTSAASIPLVLANAVRKNKIKSGDKILMVGFGAGLSYAACIVEW